MADQQDRQDPDQLAKVSGELILGLRACHSIIDDYRSKFAANLNDPEAANEEVALDDQGDDSRHG